MRPTITIDATCDLCAGQTTVIYRNSKSVADIKSRTKEWTLYDGENLCPACRGARKGKRIRLWCDVTCCICGTSAGEYYENAKTIARIKRRTAGWRDMDKYGGTVCASCQQDIKEGTIEDKLAMYEYDNTRN